jgi:hypothetical protein
MVIMPIMPRVQTRFVVVLLTALVIGASGCQPHADSDEEELVHVSAAHRPDHLPDAVAQIERRNPFKASDENNTNAQLPLSELKDILVWLPEIAADTDLKKPAWDEIRSLSLELEKLISKPTTDVAAANRYAAIVVRLHELTKGWDSWRTHSASGPVPFPPDRPDRPEQTPAPDASPMPPR